MEQRGAAGMADTKLNRDTGQCSVFKTIYALVNIWMIFNQGLTLDFCD